MIHIELPYDRGHQWHLVVGEEKAVLSEHAKKARAMLKSAGIDA